MRLPFPSINDEGIPICDHSTCPHMKNAWNPGIRFPKKYALESGIYEPHLKDACGRSAPGAPCQPALLVAGVEAARMARVLKDRMAITVGGPIYKKIMKAISPRGEESL